MNHESAVSPIEFSSRPSAFSTTPLKAVQVTCSHCGHVTSVPFEHARDVLVAIRLQSRILGVEISCEKCRQPTIFRFPESPSIDEPSHPMANPGDCERSPTSAKSSDSE